MPADEVAGAAHGLHLLPALNGSFALANLDDDAREPRASTPSTELAHRFDTLVIDTAAGIGATAMGLAGAAADVVVVARAEPLSLADAYACIKVLGPARAAPGLPVLPNDVRSPSEADEVFGRLRVLVERFLGVEILPLPPVPYDRRYRAAIAGVPLLLHSPDAPAARAIRAAARRLDALTL